MTVTNWHSGRVSAIRTVPKIRSVELERLIAQGLTLIERRNVIEYFREQAAEHFAETHRITLAAARGIEG